MALKIKANSFFMTRWLEVRSDGVRFCETAALGGVRQFKFEQVECVLLSAEGLLSFQVGQEVFSLPVKPGQEKHQKVIDALLQEVRRANP
jgi:hypothetical protein